MPYLWLIFPIAGVVGFVILATLPDVHRDE